TRATGANSAGDKFALVVVLGALRQPGREIIVGGARQGDAPDSVLRCAKADLAFLGSALFADPDHHESRTHVAALQTYDKAGLQSRGNAEEPRATGGNVQGFCALREHLTRAV